MWQPEPGWERLPGSGPSTAGVWRAVEHGVPMAVKRLIAPTEHDPFDFAEPSNAAWWRRAADVASSGIVAQTPGLRSAETVRVEPDVEGVTIYTAWVDDMGNPGLFLAQALGRFAGARLPDQAWLTRHQLRSRLGHVAWRGGWKLLARTPIADVADALWTRRERHLAVLDELPQVPMHGDAVPGNLLGRAGEDVVAIDWGTLGRGPVGADLGYLALSARESFPTMLDAYCGGLPSAVATREQAAMGARITMVYTSLTRADWALARVADGEGALAGKFRHPAVAPYLLALQRNYDEIETLVTG